MSKLKVGDITIENGSISFSQHQSTNTEPAPVSRPHTTHKESNLKETMAKMPGPPFLWVGAAILSSVIGVALWSFVRSLILIFAPPLVFFGIFSLGVAFVKRTHAQNLERETQKNEQNLVQEQKAKILAVLENKSEQWTFEKLCTTLELPQEDLLIALKACVDEKQVEEELDTNTGDWYYVWQEPEKQHLRPRSLDERLRDIKKD